ncbi:MAG: YhfC family glutamic-type intramembrane protease [Anaerolineae bacterium]
MESSTVIAFVVSILLQVGFPLAIALRFRRDTRASWQLFAFGAAVFAVFQLFTWLPVSVYLDTLIGLQPISDTASFAWMMALALSTSLVEEGGRWLGFRYLFPRGPFRLSWRNGVMYGLGHASLETVVLFAGLTFAYFILYVVLHQFDFELLTLSMSEEASPTLVEALQAIRQTSWEQPLVVAAERLMALPHQVAWSLLVMQSLVSRQKRWFGFAVLYHTSVAIIVPGLARLAGFTLAEGVNLLLALLSLWIIARLRAVAPELGSNARPEPMVRKGA